jgi:hypothetical protein
MTTPVKIEYKFVPASRLEGPKTWYVYVYEAAYRDNGTMYPKIVDVKSCKGTKLGLKTLEEYIARTYQSIVEELDSTPKFVQHALF